MGAVGVNSGEGADLYEDHERVARFDQRLSYDDERVEHAVSEVQKQRILSMQQLTGCNYC